MEEIDIARYTMSKEQFQGICEKKKKYFELVDAAYEKIKETKANIDTQIGLYEYLKKDIFEALKSGAKVEEFTTGIAVEIGKLMGDKVEGKYDLDAERLLLITFQTPVRPCSSTHPTQLLPRRNSLLLQITPGKTWKKRLRSPARRIS